MFHGEIDEFKNWEDSLTDDDISLYFHKNKDVAFLNTSNDYNIETLVTRLSKNPRKADPDYQKRIIQLCGNKIFEKICLYENLNSSECIVTENSSFLPFKNIIHVSLPKFSENHQIAYESSLHLSVRNVIDTCIQNEFRSIAFTHEIIQPNHSFPVISSITVICRTIRKCLEKLNNKFDSVLFFIDDKELHDKFRHNLKMYFPRNQLEEKFYAKFLPNIQQTEFGDIIYPERYLNVKSEFSCGKAKSQVFENFDMRIGNAIEGMYIEDQDDIRNYKIYRNDEQRIKDSVLNSNDFARQFYFENHKLVTDEMEIFFNNLNFIQFKGTDILNRQLFFVYLDRIALYDLDNDHLSDHLIIYLTKYLKSNIKSNTERIYFIVLCNNIQRKNFPTIYFLKTLSKILTSYTIEKICNINSNGIIFFQPSFMLKMFIYFTRIYIDKQIWNLIEFVSTYHDLNEKFFLELSEDYNQTTSIKSDIKNPNSQTNQSDKSSDIINLDI